MRTPQLRRSSLRVRGMTWQQEYLTPYSGHLLDSIGSIVNVKQKPKIKQDECRIMTTELF